MKPAKQSYFKDELRKLFVEYAIIPAAVITLSFLLIFIVVLMNTRLTANRADNQRIAGELETVVDAYQEEVARLADSVVFFDETSPTSADTVPIFTGLYQLNAELSHNAELFILDADKTPLLSSTRELPGFLDASPDVSWGIYRAMNESAGETVLQILQEDGRTTAWLALGRCVRSPQGNVRGYIVLAIPDGDFRILADSVDTQAIVTDRLGWVYLANNYTFLDNVHRISASLEHADRQLSAGGSRFLLARSSICGGALMVYSLSNITDTVQSLLLCCLMMLTALLGITVWVLVSSKRVTEKKTRDFYTLLDAMEKVREGDLDVAIQLDGDNEFQIIADACQEMTAGLKTQMENNQKMADLVVYAQTKQLESQFNPHFLFNTLENIRYLYKIDPKIAEKMMLSLSALLRYSLKNAENQVPLSEDLHYLENYLTILKYRYNRRFSYRIDITPEAMDCLIPRLIVQPMIENAVKYGFGGRETLEVELKAYCHEGSLTIICRDDGVGIPDAIHRELAETLGSEENRSGHFGLYNIHRRIHLLYGKPYGITIRSQEGYGTTLIVTLPQRHRDEAQP